MFYQYDDYSGDWLESSQQIPYEDDEDDPDTRTLTPVAIGNDILLVLANSGFNYTESTGSNFNNTNFYRISFVNETAQSECNFCYRPALLIMCNYNHACVFKGILYP